ncbi:UBC-like protein, partial [Gonapodya prolifera JEL478]
SLLQWHATVCGLRETPWEGGIFKLELIFDENYDCTPPEVRFKTIPFHPNVDVMTGRPSFDFIPGMGITSLLLQLQNILAFPSLECPMNPLAGELFATQPKFCVQLIRDSVAESRRVDLKAPQQNVEAENSGDTPIGCQPLLPSLRRKVPFENYFIEWSKSGVSK